MPLVTILTPVYNAERHLRSCIESVVRQTFGDWEYIIVNNCSQDRTMEIAEEYAAQEKRIRIVRNLRFVGVIENHNIAFSQISPHAKYCKVIQGDDWMFPECIEKFVEIAEKHPTVVLASAYRLDGEKIGLKGLPPSESVFAGRAIGRRSLLSQIPEIFGSPSSHFYKADSIRSHQPFYNVSNIHADTEACLNVLRNGDFGFIHEVLTFTRRPGDSQTAKSDYLRLRYPGWLWILKNHGRDFLTEEEYRQVFNAHLRQYYLVLGRELLTFRRGSEYWRHHLSALRTLGYPFNPLRLLATIPLAFVKKFAK
jgi:glycosyltransferase involved in cell wall biosynthesis